LRAPAIKNGEMSERIIHGRVGPGA
jgi:hypothetical protein